MAYWRRGSDVRRPEREEAEWYVRTALTTKFRDPRGASRLPLRATLVHSSLRSTNRLARPPRVSKPSVRAHGGAGTPGVGSLTPGAARLAMHPFALSKEKTKSAGER
ncbi:hypothetical protein GCM10010246_64040 [Streptomyces cuspidosporus]|uniref:Uncharacterized protein n=1 Tax=Streptomyces cuspidosporus TaxID=66882 RepID=A0ABP5TY39_9ACTN